MKNLRTIIMTMIVVLGLSGSLQAITVHRYNIRLESCMRNYTNSVNGWNVAYRATQETDSGEYGVSGIVNAASNTGILWCDVQLPDDATISYVELSGRDQSNYNISATLYKAYYQSSTATIVAYLLTSGNSPSWFSWYSTVVNEPVDNLNNSYWVMLNMPSSNLSEVMQPNRIVVWYNLP